MDANLSSVSQAGLVNNLNDGMAWGLFPLVFAAAGMDLAEVGLLAAIYPATWGLAQLLTGALSDRTGRKPLIVSGMWTQAAGIGVVTLARTFAGFAAGATLLGIGTAMVYPTLLAAIGDVSHPSWRASAIGVYRLWRDLGYAVGALLAGITADAFGLSAAMWVIAGLTLCPGLYRPLVWQKHCRPTHTADGMMATQIETHTLREWLEAQQPVTVLDIRTDDDRIQWAIPGSLHVNAYEALQDGQPGALADLVLPADRPVITVCNAGKVSQIAADVLANRGFDARSLAGGMKAWSLAWNVADVPLADASVSVMQVRRTGKGCLSYMVRIGWRGGGRRPVGRVRRIPRHRATSSLVHPVRTRNPHPRRPPVRAPVNWLARQVRCSCCLPRIASGLRSLRSQTERWYEWGTPDSARSTHLATPTRARHTS
jgi:rhodanese-related sulfurtransferase